MHTNIFVTIIKYIYIYILFIFYQTEYFIVYIYIHITGAPTRQNVPRIVELVYQLQCLLRKDGISRYTNLPFSLTTCFSNGFYEDDNHENLIQILEKYWDTQLDPESRTILKKEGYIPGSKRPQDWEIDDATRNPAYGWLKRYIMENHNETIIRKVFTNYSSEHGFLKQLALSNDSIVGLLNSFMRKLAMNMKEVEIFILKHMHNYKEWSAEQKKITPFKFTYSDNIVEYFHTYQALLQNKPEEAQYEYEKTMSKSALQLQNLWNETSNLNSRIYLATNTQVVQNVIQLLRETESLNKYNNVFEKVIRYEMNRYIAYQQQQVSNISSSTYPTCEEQIKIWLQLFDTSSVWFYSVLVKNLALEFTQFAKNNNLSTSQWEDSVYKSFIDYIKSVRFMLNHYDNNNHKQRHNNNNEQEHHNAFLSQFWSTKQTELIYLLSDYTSLPMKTIETISSEWLHVYKSTCSCDCYSYDDDTNSMIQPEGIPNWYCKYTINKIIDICDSDNINPALTIRTVEERKGAELYIMRNGDTGGLIRTKVAMGSQVMSQIDNPADVLAKVHDVSQVDPTTHQGKDIAKTGEISYIM